MLTITTTQDSAELIVNGTSYNKRLLRDMNFDERGFRFYIAGAYITAPSGNDVTINGETLTPENYDTLRPLFFLADSGNNGNSGGVSPSSLISSDAGNALTAGKDEKLFTAKTFVSGITAYFLDAVNGSPDNDGLTAATPKKEFADIYNDQIVYEKLQINVAEGNYQPFNLSLFRCLNLLFIIGSGNKSNTFITTSGVTERYKIDLLIFENLTLKLANNIYVFHIANIYNVILTYSTPSYSRYFISFLGELRFDNFVNHGQTLNIYNSCYFSNTLTIYSYSNSNNAFQFYNTAYCGQSPSRITLNLTGNTNKCEFSAEYFARVPAIFFNTPNLVCDNAPGYDVLIDNGFYYLLPQNNYAKKTTDFATPVTDTNKGATMDELGKKEDISNKSQLIDDNEVRYPSNFAVKTFIEGMTLGFFKPKSIDRQNGYIIVDYSSAKFKPNYIVNSADQIPTTALDYSEGVALTLGTQSGTIDVYHSADSGATWQLVNTQPISDGFFFTKWNKIESDYWSMDEWFPLNSTIDPSLFVTVTQFNNALATKVASPTVKQIQVYAATSEPTNKVEDVMYCMI